MTDYLQYGKTYHLAFGYGSPQTFMDYYEGYGALSEAGRSIWLSPVDGSSSGNVICGSNIYIGTLGTLGVHWYMGYVQEDDYLPFVKWSNYDPNQYWSVWSTGIAQGDPIPIEVPIYFDVRQPQGKYVVAMVPAGEQPYLTILTRTNGPGAAFTACNVAPEDGKLIAVDRPLPTADQS
jgi:hypothetical protein